MTDNLDKLAAIAGAAQRRNPAPWHAVPGSEYAEDCLTIYCGDLNDLRHVAGEVEWVETAVHIAAFSPDVVLRLIAQIRTAEAATKCLYDAWADAEGDQFPIRTVFGLQMRKSARISKASRSRGASSRPRSRRSCGG